MAKPNKTKKYQIVNVGDFNACICLSTHPNNFDRKNVFNNNNDDSKTNAKLKLKRKTSTEIKQAELKNKLQTGINKLQTLKTS